MNDRIGKQLGNYRLLRLLGQGGFADVYLGEHVHLRTQAAIKVLQLRLVENNVQNFLNEARTIAHLVHPYIIRVLDFGVQDNTPFLVMDYAPKGTFRQRFLHGQRLPATPLFPYIKQAAAALQYAHDKKLIHRDVKPENMLLGPNEEVLLSDFGFALIQSSNSRSSMETAGTAAYMAPEQLQGKPRSASDQYALGVVAYEWLTGSCPFQGTFFEIASQHMLATPPSLREKVPSIPPEIEHVVMTALAKDPDQRFPAVRDFAIALERACLAVKTVHLDQPLVPPPFLSQPYRPMATNISPQGVSTTFPSSLAGEKSPTRKVAQYPFEQLSSVTFSQPNQVNMTTPPEIALGEKSPTRKVAQYPFEQLSSTAFSQSNQANITTPPETAHGGTWMNSPSPNNQPQQANQTHLAPQAGQTRPDAIGRPVDWPGNAMPLPESGTQGHAKLTEANSAMHNLSQSDRYSLSNGQFSQDNISPVQQQRSVQERTLPTFQPQNLSQSRLSWPSAEQLSQSGQRALSPEQTSQPSQNPFPWQKQSPIGQMTTMSSLQPSLSQNLHLPSSQSQPEQTVAFPPNRTQLGSVTKQQSSQVQLAAEFRNDLQRYRSRGTPTGMLIFLLIMMIFITVTGAGLIYWSSNQPNTVPGTNDNGQTRDQASTTATDTSTSLAETATAATNATETALANINPYPASTSVLVINDALNNKNPAVKWQEIAQSCQFTQGSYHALAAPNLFTACAAMGTNYGNFTYQIQMSFIRNAPKYSSGGILFRSNSDIKQFYLFEVYASGRYLFRKCSNGDSNCSILAGSPLDPPSPAFRVGQTNTVAVVANQNTFTLFINQQQVGSKQTDNSSAAYTQGMIGVIAHGGLDSDIPTEVAYSNIKVWK